MQPKFPISVERQLDAGRIVLQLHEVDIVTENSGGKLEPRLSVPAALLVLLRGEAVLKRDASEVSMQPDTVYYCPPGGTFGLTAGLEDGASVGVVSFTLYEAAGADFGAIRTPGPARTGQMSLLSGPNRMQEPNRDPDSNWTQAPNRMPDPDRILETGRELGPDRAQAPNRAPGSDRMQEPNKDLGANRTPGPARMLAPSAAALLPPGCGSAQLAAGRAAALCRSMHERLRSGDALERWRAQIECQELVYETLRAAGPGDSLVPNGTYSVEKAKLHLEEHYKEELTLEKLAAVAELSPNYFAELFKKAYGLTPMEHLTRVRMSKAKQLMLGGNRLLREIAHEVGYEDEFYFSRKFKQTAGMPPSIFIKKRRRKVAVYGSTSLIGYLTPLHIVPYAAPLHPKWAGHYYDRLGPEIPVHLDAYRQNHRKAANLEQLAEAKPELILCPSGVEGWEKQRLAAIAEVYELRSGETDWRKQLKEVAKLFGEEAEAEQWLRAYAAKAAAAQSRTGRRPNGPESVATVRMLKDRFYLHCTQAMGDVLFGGLGLRPAFSGAALPPLDLPVSLERLDNEAADRVLLLVCQETETIAAFKRLQQSPRWLSLRMVRDGRLRLIGSEPWRESSPDARERMLDEAVKLFAEDRPYIFR